MSLSIAIFGNTNNSSLFLAKGMKELGHEVRLILNRKEALHRPESCHPIWRDAYPEWIVDCSKMTDEDIAFQTEEMDKSVHYLTHGIDLAILNDTGPALAGYLNIPYVVFLTGSDLSYWANFNMLNLRTAQWAPEFKKSPQGRQYIMRFIDLVARQRDGILGANLVCYPQRGTIPSGDLLLDEIGVLNSCRFMLFSCNLTDLKPRKLNDNRRLIILNGARINFKLESHPELSAIDFKGTDILLEGFAQYIKAGGSGELRMVRKGWDIDAALALIEELGIQCHIKWLDEMPLEQFHHEMIAADLICDQFGTSLPGGVTLDAYALGRVVMANLRKDIFRKRFPKPLPGFDVETPSEVAQALGRLEHNRRLLIDMGDQSRYYAETYLSTSSMCSELLSRVIS